jgi:hypothetical protein
VVNNVAWMPIRERQSGRKSSTTADRPFDGAHPPAAPAIENLWTSTFNLRWSDHIQLERQIASPNAVSGTGRAKSA